MEAINISIDNLDTVDKIAKYTQKEVTKYRQLPSKKLEVVGRLSPLFSAEATAWAKVIDMGKFRNSFTRVLGKNGMKALKKLLYELDKAKYQEIDFGTDI